MRSTRRDFVGISLAAAAATQANGQAPATPPADKPTLVPRAGGDLLTRMSWLNPPAHEHYSEGKLSARSKGKTDFWRKTFYGYVTDNGHFLHLPVAGEFKFTARVDGNYAALYDQAGLMVRLDEKRWMKCGSEFFDDKRWASVVFTHDFSDWSTLDDLTQVGPVYWRVVRTRDAIEAQCSKDGEKFQTVRQGYFPPGVEVQVGVMCAAPEGPGFDCVFDQISIDKL
jgi:regulation of enolase protein 1 (concanavalin A-like superfamily)